MEAINGIALPVVALSGVARLKAVAPARPVSWQCLDDERPRISPIRGRKQFQPNLQQLQETIVSNIKSLIIGALAVGVVVLGYFYYQDQRNTVQIKLPTVKVQ
jgi:RsiW-degrading membrane proteinase PrsW (M82 family)